MDSIDISSSLSTRMAELGIEEEDLIEKFIQGSGPGGQKINKTASCVYLKHVPSGEEVKCQEDRSRAGNRERARGILCDRLEGAAETRRAQRKHERERKRRRHRRPSKAARKRNVEKKRRHGAVKALRKSPGKDE